MKDGRIPGYFDTKYMTVLQIKQILHTFEGQKIANFFNLQQVYFRVTGGGVHKFQLWQSTGVNSG